MTPEEQLTELGYTLPKAPAPIANYVGAVQTGNLQPKVINGASDLLVGVFGERGRHARSAVGMAALPQGIRVEIEMIVELGAAS